MHKGVSILQEEGIDLWSRHPLVRIEPVGDENPVDSQARAEVFHDRLSHADNCVRRPQDVPLKPLIEPALNRRRPRRSRRLEGPTVTQLGDPGDAATTQRTAEQVGRLWRRGRYDAVESPASCEAEDLGEREWHPANERQVGDYDRLEPAGRPIRGSRSAAKSVEVSASPVQRARQRVHRSHNLIGPFDRPMAGSGRGEDGDRIAEPRQILRQPSDSTCGDEIRGRRELRDDQN